MLIRRACSERVRRSFRGRRWRSLVSIGLLLAIGSYGCASEPPRSDPGVPGVPGRVEAEEKSALVAELLAIFPGILLHGLGNLYAGKKDRAQDLMAEEGIGVGAMAIGTGLTFLGLDSHRHADHSKGAESVLYRVDESFTFLGAAAGAGFGVAFFFDSWIRDMVEAPGAVESHNREMRRLYDESIHTVPEDAAAPVITAGAPTEHPRSP